MLNVTLDTRDSFTGTHCGNAELWETLARLLKEKEKGTCYTSEMHRFTLGSHEIIEKLPNHSESPVTARTRIHCDDIRTLPRVIFDDRSSTNTEFIRHLLDKVCQLHIMNIPLLVAWSGVCRKTNMSKAVNTRVH